MTSPYEKVLVHGHIADSAQPRKASNVTRPFPYLVGLETRLAGQRPVRAKTCMHKSTLMMSMHMHKSTLHSSAWLIYKLGHAMWSATVPVFRSCTEAI